MSFSLLILIWFAFGAILVTAAIQRRFGRLGNVSQGLLVSYLTVTLVLAAGELYFRYCHANSDYWWTLAAKNWQHKHVQTNALGFRDRDWLPADYQDKTIVLVIGDSFTMGDGIPNVEDRFSDVLAELLGPAYAVMNLGLPDTSTRDQLAVLEDYPIKNPDIIIWQYFLNDINDAGASIGDQYWPRLPRNYPQFIDESYLANYVYWQLAPYFTPVDTADKDSFWGWAYYAYDNSAIWAIHEEEIRNLAAYAQSVGARLIVVIFPNLRQPLESVPYVDRVAQALEAAQVTDILRLYDAASYFIEHQEDSIVVSARDDHPSAAFHHYVGRLIYDAFFADN